MVSTYLDYNLVSRDMKASLKRTAEQTQVARDTAYYKENIGDVTSVDEFLDNYRLYSYAMKAHGLEDMTYAKAFMRKVMESDLDDDESYANQLTDDRYRNFAMAFSFSKSTNVVQSASQEEAVIGLYNETIADQDAAVRSDTVYFNAAIDRVTNIDQVWQNEKLKGYVFQALGLDSRYVSYDHFKAVVTSDVNDPNSYVNTTAASHLQSLQDQIDSIRGSASSSDLADPKSAASLKIAEYQSAIDNAPDYKPLASIFNFQPDGTLAAGDLPMTNANKASVNEAYVYEQPRTSSSLAALNKLYFESNINSVTTANDIVANSRLSSYIRVSFGLPASTLNATLENILTSDVNDPNSYANTSGGALNTVYKQVAAAFNFQNDGTLASGDTPQTAAQTKTTSDNYMTRYNDADDAADETLIKSYKSLIGVVDNVDDFLADKKIMTLVLKAFGLEEEGDSTRKLKKVLTSDLNDPKSYANTLKDIRYTDLVKAFNFNADGSLGSPTLAQSQSEILNTAKSYVIAKSRFGNEEDKTKATAEASYYSEQIEKIDKLGDLLGNKRLVNFVLVAAGIDPKTVDAASLKKMFQSDLDDPESYVNTQDDPRFREIVASFNFNAKGQVERPKEAQIQTRRGLIETESLYLNQTLEETKGEDNAGVRLALYFKRKASEVGSAYDLLADSALQQVVRTIFSIPEELSQSDIDVQYAYYNRVLDIKDLQDPEKLDKLLLRFTALYDVENNTDASAALTIFSGGTGSISADTLFTLAGLRAGGR